MVCLLILDFEQQMLLFFSWVTTSWKTRYAILPNPGIAPSQVKPIAAIFSASQHIPWGKGRTVLTSFRFLKNFLDTCSKSVSFSSRLRSNSDILANSQLRLVNIFNPVLMHDMKIPRWSYDCAQSLERSRRVTFTSPQERVIIFNTFGDTARFHSCTSSVQCKIGIWLQIVLFQIPDESQKFVDWFILSSDFKLVQNFLICAYCRRHLQPSSLTKRGRSLAGFKVLPYAD